MDSIIDSRELRKRGLRLIRLADQQELLESRIKSALKLEPMDILGNYILHSLTP